MKFVIESTCYNNEEKLLQTYPFLREYGFEAVEREYQTYSYWSKTYNNMTETVYYIHIKDLEELLRLKEQCREELVITNQIHTDEICIEIYDGYRE